MTRRLNNQAPSGAPRLPNTQIGVVEDSHIAISASELRAQCEQAIRHSGGSDQMASALANATVDAELRNKPQLGVMHLLDYLDALENNEINRKAEPKVIPSAPAVLVVDADFGIAQASFDTALPHMLHSADGLGLCMLSIRNTYPAGELAYYTTRLAERGLIALAGANSVALMSIFGSQTPVTGTNPLSFALPHRLGPRVFDQACSATAWVKVRQAAHRGESIPQGWALNEQGEMTTDAREAMSGALLPFGGIKASNLALMVEMLAVLGGADFSLDVTSLKSQGHRTGVGLFVIAIDPAAFDSAYQSRVDEHLERLERSFGISFGRHSNKRDATSETARDGSTVSVPDSILTALRAASPPRPSQQEQP